MEGSTYFFRRNLKQLPSAVDGLTPMRKAILTALARESPNKIVDADLLAAQVRYKTKYKTRTADIAWSIVAMSKVDIKQLAVSYLVRGRRKSDPYYGGIQCVGKLISLLYPPDELIDDLLPVPVIPLHLIQGWNHIGVGMNSTFNLDLTKIDDTKYIYIVFYINQMLCFMVISPNVVNLWLSNRNNYPVKTIRREIK